MRPGGHADVLTDRLTALERESRASAQATLELTGDPAFPRRLAGPKPCLKRESMGRCDGRCTLVVICSLQLVRGMCNGG